MKIELYVTLCLCSRQLSVFGKVGMRVVVFAFAFVLGFVSARRKTGVRFVFFFCVIFPCFHLRVASLRNSFADRIEYNLVLMCATGFFLFCPLRIRFIFACTC